MKHKGCTDAVCTTYTGCMGYCFCVEMCVGKPFCILSTFFYMFQDVQGKIHRCQLPHLCDWFSCLLSPRNRLPGFVKRKLFKEINRRVFYYKLSHWRIYRPITKLHPQEVSAISDHALHCSHVLYIAIVTTWTCGNIYNAIIVSLTATIYVCDCLAILLVFCKAM